MSSSRLQGADGAIRRFSPKRLDPTREADVGTQATSLVQRKFGAVVENNGPVVPTNASSTLPYGWELLVL